MPLPCPTCGLPLAALPPVSTSGLPAECEPVHLASGALPRLVTAADLGLTSADLMAYADKPGPSVAASVLARATTPSDPAADLRALQARLERTGWFGVPLPGPDAGPTGQ